MSNTFTDRPRELTPAEVRTLAAAPAAASEPPRPDLDPPNGGASSGHGGPTLAPPTAGPPTRGFAAGPATAGKAGAGRAVGGRFAAGATTGWTTVSALWAINQADNAWFYDANAGWMRISNTSDVGTEAVNSVAAHAKAFGGSVQYTTDATSGLVTQMYCF